MIYSYNRRVFLKCVGKVWSTISTKSSARRYLSSFSKTEVTIPVPITGGHLAAQLWEGRKCDETASLAYPTPIICMHGFQDNSSSFDPLIPLIIQDNMTIIAPDQPGHGLSSHLRGSGYDFLLDGLATIHRVIRHFGWPKVTLIGHSYGANMSFVFTGTYQDKVHKYVAIENLHPVARETDFHLNRTFKALFEVEAKLADPTRTQPRYTYEQIFQRTVKARKHSLSEEGVEVLLKRGVVPDSKDSNLFRFSHDIKTNIPSMFARFSDEESLKIASNIKCPVCVIKGEPGHDYEPRENFMRMVNAVRAANGGKLDFQLVPGTHHLHVNEPSLVAPIISNFLKTNFSS